MWRTSSLSSTLITQTALRTMSTVLDVLHDPLRPARHILSLLLATSSRRRIWFLCYVRPSRWSAPNSSRWQSLHATRARVSQHCSKSFSDKPPLLTSATLCFVIDNGTLWNLCDQGAFFSPSKPILYIYKYHSHCYDPGINYPWTAKLNLSLWCWWRSCIVWGTD